jgi:hypothetical protein
LEPIVLGLAVAPSQAGLSLGLAAIAGFLLRHPVKLALADRRRRVRYSRTAWAERFAVLYGAVAAGAMVLAVGTAGAAAGTVLGMAVVLVLIQFRYDLRHQQRQLVPEIAGAAALSMMAPAIALAGGWASAPAVALWLVLMARAAPAILYVRARLRQMRGVRAPIAPPLLAHVGGLAIVGGLTAARLVPWTGTVALAVLLARAVHGLVWAGVPARAAVVGIQELVYGVLLIVLLVVGYLA